jgi:DNA polymerase-3 subunit alpha
MVYFSLEGLTGSVEAVAFPKVVAEYGPMIREDAVVVLRGRVDHRGDEVKFIVQAVQEPDLTTDDSVRVRVAATRMSAAAAEKLKNVLANHPGSSPVFIHMTAESGERIIRVSPDHAVNPRSALFAELRELFGPSSVM